MTAIYRSFDRAGLDAAYNNRAHAPDFQRHVDRWQADSVAARKSVPCKLDLAYGPSERQRLDVFSPPGPASAGGRPALLYFHGGYWQGNHKDSYSFPAPLVTGVGALYIAATYDLCPSVTMSELVEQVRRAVIWLHGNATRIGLDPRRIVVAGHSAGGHIAATLAHTDWSSYGLPSNALAGALPLSGLFDLEPIRLCYLNDACQMDAAEARRLSPIHHISRLAPPMVLVVGAAELPELVRQTRDYAQALTRAGSAPLSVIETPGDNHFSVLDRLFDPHGTAWEALRELIVP